MIEPPLERYVLCLDDDSDFIKSLEAFLPGQINGSRTDGMWYRFVFLQDPGEALEVLAELVNEGATVAMLISDQQMPSMKGIEVLQRARDISSHSMRILLTGHAGIEAAIAAINDRLLDRYLTKPIEDEHDFTLSVRQLLQHFEMHRVIEAQRAALQDLYRFANTINAMADLDGMLGYIAHYTQTALHCSQVSATVCAPGGRRHSATVGLDGSRIGGGPETEPTPAIPRHGVARTPDALPREVLEAVRGSGMDLSRPVAFARLGTEEDPIGLIVAADGAAAFDETDLQTLGYIGDTASIAIHKQLMWTQLAEAHRLTQQQAEVLDHANTRLARLDEMKIEFLRFISHELRTPLSYMSAIGLLEQPLTPKDWKEVGDIIQRGYRRLDAFIAAGLDYFSWCGTGRVETSELTDWTRIVTTEWLEEVVGPGVVRRLVTPTRPCEVRMSQATAVSILRVLVENAVKFSPDAPHVEIELTGSPDLVRLAVRDRGRGFAPEIGPELFRPFTVMDTLHHREGTGLSLARTSAMVEAHGGCVRAESEGPGRGATFIVELPTHDSATGLELGSDPPIERRAA